MRQNQQGVALIFVLLIFVMMTVVASRIISDMQLNTEKTAQRLQYQQAKHYAKGGEQFAMVLLEDDAARDKQAEKKVDHWHEAWAANDDALETDEGEITMLIVDDQGRFNLNLLAEKNISAAPSASSNSASGGAGSDNSGTQRNTGTQGSRDNRDSSNVGGSSSIAGASVEQSTKMLSRMLETHKINAQLADRLRDWVDSNQEARPAGAEDNYYLLRDDNPYRTGDTELASVSELRLLDILTPENYQTLEPLVSVLPPGVGVNMNTVTAPTLVALVKEMSLTEAQSFIDSRPTEGFAEVREVINHPLLKGKLIDGAEQVMTVSSNYFSVYVKARYRDLTYYLHSRLARDDQGRVSVISREVGTFPQWVERLRESVK